MLCCISGAVGVSSKFSSFFFFFFHMTSEGRFSKSPWYVRRFTDALTYTRTKTVTLRPFVFHPRCRWTSGDRAAALRIHFCWLDIVKPNQSASETHRL